MENYITSANEIKVNFDKFHFIKREKDGHCFYFLVLGNDYDTADSFVDCIFGSETLPQNNPAVLEAVLEVGEDGKIIPQGQGTSNTHLSTYLRQQLGGLTRGGLWVRKANDQETVEAAAERVRNIASMFNSLQAGRNPPEMFISLASRNISLEHCRLLSNIGADKRDVYIDCTTDKALERIMKRLEVGKTVACPFITNKHMSTIIVKRTEENNFTIEHLDSLGEQNQAYLKAIVRVLEKGGLKIDLQNHELCHSQSGGMSCSYHSEANVALASDYLSFNGDNFETLLEHIKTPEYRQHLINTVLSTLSCNPDYDIRARGSENRVRQEFAECVDDAGNMLKRAKVYDFKIANIINTGILADINDISSQLPDGALAVVGNLVRRTSDLDSYEMLLEESISALPGGNIFQDKHLSQSPLNQQVLSHPKMPPTPYISETVITTDKDLKTTIISFKTLNPKIFKDIEEIRITLPGKTKVDEKYLRLLHDDIIRKGFINDYTCLDCVSLKKRGRNVYEKMLPFTNTALAVRYSAEVNGGMRER